MCLPILMTGVTRTPTEVQFVKIIHYRSIGFCVCALGT